MKLNSLIRLFLLLLIGLVGVSAVSAKAQESVAKTINEKKSKPSTRLFVPLSEALSKLAQDYGIHFLYEDRVVAGKFVKVPKSNSRGFYETLKMIIGKYPLSYKKVGMKTIVLTEPDKVPENSITSIVDGRVLDENGLPLPGANIFISNTDQAIGTSSDLEGHFVLKAAPVGRQNIKVTYMGFHPEIVNVDIRENAVSKIDVTLKSSTVYAGKVVIIGERLKGQAKALNHQKTIDNITNIISIDQIDKYPDSNIGDALKRIPGITMQTDQGEARNIIIRGLGPTISCVQVNGERISSAESFTRKLYLDLLPADMIQTVEVYKTVTPDMDADITGGAVNLITRSAPHITTFSTTLNSGVSFIENKPIWYGTVIYGKRLIKDKFGLFLSGTYNSKDYGSHNIEALWDLDGEGQVYLKDFQIRRYLVQRIRKSMTGYLDFSFSPLSTITFKIAYNERQDRENRFRQRYANMQPVNENGVTNIDYRVQTRGGINGQPRRLDEKTIISTVLAGNHLIGDRLQLNWSANYGSAKRNRVRRYFEWQVKGVDSSPDISDKRRPSIKPVNPEVLIPANMTLREIQQDALINIEKDYRARLDFKIPLLINNKDGFIQLGGKYQRKERKTEDLYQEFQPVNMEDWLTLNQHPKMDLSVDNFMAGDYRFSFPFTTPGFLSDTNLFNANDFVINNVYDEFITRNYQAAETVQAGYVMFSQNITEKFKILTGLRIEHTELTYQASEFDEDTQAVKPTGKVKKNHINYLPNITLRYDLDENTVLRFASTSTIIRPNYHALAPFKSFSLKDRTLGEGNPGLKPSSVMNFDLIGEKYFESIGQFSVGVYFKNIDDFIFNYRQRFTEENLFQGQFEQYQQPRNGGSVKVYGIETSFQRRLDFLPGILRNLYTNINFSVTKSQVDGLLIAGRENEKLPLESSADYTLNSSLSYETRKFLVTASFHYTDDYLDSYGKAAFYDVYYDSQTFIDINSAYRITPRINVFFEANNLTNQPLRYYQGTNELIRQLEFYGRTINFGIKFNY